MTIYAIVNNLLSPELQSKDSTPIWTLISQTGILHGGNPYFVPDFASHFEARLALAVRIGRLGKGIAPRFAYRYAEAVAPAVVFVAADKLKSLQASGCPWTEAISYDRCLAIGKFEAFTLEEMKQSEVKLHFDSDGTTRDAIWDKEAMRPGIEETIAAISRDNTLKTGDIILFGLSGEGPEVSPDARVHLRLNGNDSLSFNIR